MNILCYISFVALYIGTDVLALMTRLYYGDAPFFVVIRCDDVNVGNGAIITTEFVLTSKFIVENKEECEVVFGISQYNEIASNNTKAISKIIKEDPDVDFDEYFVLLKVDTPFVFDENVNSVNFVPYELISATNGTLYFRTIDPLSAVDISVSEDIRLMKDFVNTYKYAIPKYKGDQELLIAGSPYLMDQGLCKMVITSSEDDDFDFLVDIREKLDWIFTKISEE